MMTAPEAKFLHTQIMKELTSVPQPYKFNVDYDLVPATGEVILIIYGDQFHSAPDHKMLEAAQWLHDRLTNLNSQGIPITLEKR